MLFVEAQAILNGHCQHFENKDASTNTVVQDRPSLEGVNESWWHQFWENAGLAKP
jgi:hypothetical protein